MDSIQFFSAKVVTLTILCYTTECIYRIASNLTDISNYPDTISNQFFTANYTVQSMKFEIFVVLIIRTSSFGQLALASYLSYSYTRICTYGNAYTTKVQIKTRLASTVQAGVQPVSSLAALEVLIGEATVSVANGYNEVLLQQACNRQLFLWWC